MLDPDRLTPPASPAIVRPAGERLRGGHTVYFLPHVPRTGGSTIQVHLQTYLAEKFWVPARPTTLAMLAGRRQGRDNLPDLARVRAVAGHNIGRSLERHFAGSEIRRAVLLRDPVGLHVSYYNHRMMFSLSRGGPVCDFDRHLRAQPRDLVALLLLWYWLELPLATMLATSNQRKYELLNEALSRFWFVGSHRDGDRLLAAIAPDLGVPGVAPRRNTTLQWQKRVDWRPLRCDDLTASTRAMILAHNPVHDALWHSWRDAGFATGAVVPRPLPQGRSPRIGVQDLLRGILADRMIAPIWHKAGRASRARQWRRAAQLYRKALRRAPNSPEVWVQYGHALRESGDITAAAAAYRRAIELDPETGEWHLFLGHALSEQGRTAEAGEAYRQFERLDPELLKRKREEMIARGCPEEVVSSLWRSLTEQSAPGSG